MKRAIVLGIAALCAFGCKGSDGDVSQEASPSATGPKVKSTGKAELRTSMDKLKPVGTGDGVMKMDSK